MNAPTVPAPPALSTRMAEELRRAQTLLAEIDANPRYDANEMARQVGALKSALRFLTKAVEADATQRTTGVTAR